MRDVLVELAVLLVLDVLRGQRPERLRVIHLDPVPHGFGVLLLVRRGFLFPEPDRGRDVVRVLRDHFAERPFGEERLLRVLERQDHVGAAAFLRHCFARVGAAPVALPPDRLVRTGLRGARDHRHLVRHDEGAVEADTELADQLRSLRLVLREVLEELLGPGLRDRPEVLVRFLKRHPDAVIRDRESARLLVRLHADPEEGIVLCEGGVLDREEPELVHRVGRVRDQFAKEDLLVRIKRIREKLEELRHFGLEAVNVCSHF